MEKTTTLASSKNEIVSTHIPDDIHFHQQFGADYSETFPPVIKPVTVRTILTLALTQSWPFLQRDVNNVFFNGLLDEEVYMVQPPCFVSFDKALMRKLNKAVYGLKQAPRAWFEDYSTLIKLVCQQVDVILHF